MNMTISSAGIALIEQFEGLRLTAYRDCAGVWTIGYGHTGRGVGPGMSITRDQAGQLLLQDTASACSFLNNHVARPVTQNQFDALADFTFNLGCGALLNSTLLREVNAGSFATAATQFAAWDHAGGVVVEGLARRRAAEANLFRKPDGAA